MQSSSIHSKMVRRWPVKMGRPLRASWPLPLFFGGAGFSALLEAPLFLTSLFSKLAIGFGD